MLRWIAMWVVRVAMAAAAAFALLYLGDWAVFAARGGPRGSVTVDHTLVVPLKGNKREYVDQGAAQQPCAEALFGQSGLDACWRLRQNPQQETAY
jgi:hypothetical protein